MSSCYEKLKMVTVRPFRHERHGKRNRLWFRFIGLQTLVTFCCFNAYDRYLLKQERHEELLELLKCSSSNWEDCRQSVSRAAAYNDVLAREIATAREDTLQRAQEGPVEYDNVRILRDGHPALVPMDSHYQPPSDWNVDVALPDIEIAGLPKAGTTNLYTILTNHPDGAVYSEDHQEQCMIRSGLRYKFEDWAENKPIHSHRSTPTQDQLEMQRYIYDYYQERFFQDSALQKEPKTGRALTVNACYLIHDIELTRNYLLPYASPERRNSTKYIMIFRDPADWLWSAFNFWRIPGVDAEDYGWTQDDKDYRSPELFHEFMVSKNKTQWGTETYDYYQSFTVVSPRKLLGMFDRRNVLFLKNEDMLPSVVDRPGGMLDRLSSFTGLQRAGFASTSYASLMNCHEHGRQGDGHNPCSDKSRSSAYGIVGGREMLPETRTLIYLHFWEECKIWAKEFGIVYPDCLNVVDATQKRTR